MPEQPRLEDVRGLPDLASAPAQVLLVGLDPLDRNSRDEDLGALLRRRHGVDRADAAAGELAVGRSQAQHGQVGAAHGRPLDGIDRGLHQVGLLRGGQRREGVELDTCILEVLACHHRGGIRLPDAPGAGHRVRVRLRGRPGIQEPRSARLGEPDGPSHSRQRRAGCLCLLEQPRRALRRVRSRDVRALPGVRAIEGEEGDESSQGGQPQRPLVPLRRIGLCRLRGPGRSPGPRVVGAAHVTIGHAGHGTRPLDSRPATPPHPIRPDAGRRADHPRGSQRRAIRSGRPRTRGPGAVPQPRSSCGGIPALGAVSPTTLHQFWLNPGPTPGPEPPELVRGQRGGPR